MTYLTDRAGLGFWDQAWDIGESVWNMFGGEPYKEANLPPLPFQPGEVVEMLEGLPGVADELRRAIRADRDLMNAIEHRGVSFASLEDPYQLAQTALYLAGAPGRDVNTGEERIRSMVQDAMRRWADRPATIPGTQIPIPGTGSGAAAPAQGGVDWGALGIAVAAALALGAGAGFFGKG